MVIISSNLLVQEININEGVSPRNSVSEDHKGCFYQSRNSFEERVKSNEGQISHYTDL